MGRNPLVALGGSALLVSLFLVYGALATQMRAEYALQASAEQAAASAPSQATTVSGPSARCSGEQVFVYSGDFKNSSLSMQAFTCYPSQSGTMAFKDSLTLSAATACSQFLPTKTSQCAVVYYGVVPNRSISPATLENPNVFPATLDRGICSSVAYGAFTQPSSCNGVATRVRAEAKSAPFAPAPTTAAPSSQSFQLPSWTQYLPDIMLPGTSSISPSGAAPPTSAGMEYLLPPGMIGVQFKLSL